MSGRYFAPRDCPDCGREWKTSVASLRETKLRRTHKCMGCRRQPTKSRQYSPAEVLEIPGTWVTEARCGDNPELWFSSDAIEKDVARDICRSCPVILQCRNYAIDNGITDGIWGGLDNLGRRRWKARTA